METLESIHTFLTVCIFLLFTLVCVLVNKCSFLKGGGDATSCICGQFEFTGDITPSNSFIHKEPGKPPNKLSLYKFLQANAGELSASCEKCCLGTEASHTTEHGELDDAELTDGRRFLKPDEKTAESSEELLETTELALPGKTSQGSVESDLSDIIEHTVRVKVKLADSGESECCRSVLQGTRVHETPSGTRIEIKGPIFTKESDRNSPSNRPSTERNDDGVQLELTHRQKKHDSSPDNSARDSTSRGSSSKQTYLRGRGSISRHDRAARPGSSRSYDDDDGSCDDTCPAKELSPIDKKSNSKVFYKIVKICEDTCTRKTSPSPEEKYRRECDNICTKKNVEIAKKSRNGCDPICAGIRSDKFSKKSNDSSSGEEDERSEKSRKRSTRSSYGKGSNKSSNKSDDTSSGEEDEEDEKSKKSRKNSAASSNGTGSNESSDKSGDTNPEEDEKSKKHRKSSPRSSNGTGSNDSSDKSGDTNPEEDEKSKKQRKSSPRSSNGTGSNDSSDKSGDTNPEEDEKSKKHRKSSPRSSNGKGSNKSSNESDDSSSEEEDEKSEKPRKSSARSSTGIRKNKSSNKSVDTYSGEEDERVEKSRKGCASTCAGIESDKLSNRPKSATDRNGRHGYPYYRDKTSRSSVSELPDCCISGTYDIGSDKRSGIIIPIIIQAEPKRKPYDVKKLSSHQRQRSSTRMSPSRLTSLTKADEDRYNSCCGQSDNTVLMYDKITGKYKVFDKDNAIFTSEAPDSCTDIYECLPMSDDPGTFYPSDDEMNPTCGTPRKKARRPMSAGAKDGPLYRRSRLSEEGITTRNIISCKNIKRSQDSNNLEAYDSCEETCPGPSPSKSKKNIEKQSQECCRTVRKRLSFNCDDECCGKMEPKHRILDEDGPSPSKKPIHSAPEIECDKACKSSYDRIYKIEVTSPHRIRTVPDDQTYVDDGKTIKYPPFAEDGPSERAEKIRRGGSGNSRTSVSHRQDDVGRPAGQREAEDTSSAPGITSTHGAQISIYVRNKDGSIFRLYKKYDLHNCDGHTSEITYNSHTKALANISNAQSLPPEDFSRTDTYPKTTDDDIRLLYKKYGTHSVITKTDDNNTPASPFNNEAGPSHKISIQARWKLYIEGCDDTCTRGTSPFTSDESVKGRKEDSIADSKSSSIIDYSPVKETYSSDEMTTSEILQSDSTYSSSYENIVKSLIIHIRGCEGTCDAEERIIDFVADNNTDDRFADTRNINQPEPYVRIPPSDAVLHEVCSHAVEPVSPNIKASTTRKNKRESPVKNESSEVGSHVDVVSAPFDKTTEKKLPEAHDKKYPKVDSHVEVVPFSSNKIVPIPSDEKLPENDKSILKYPKIDSHAEDVPFSSNEIVPVPYDENLPETRNKKYFKVDSRAEVIPFSSNKIVPVSSDEKLPETHDKKYPNVDSHAKPIIEISPPDVVSRVRFVSTPPENMSDTCVEIPIESSSNILLLDQSKPSDFDHTPSGEKIDNNVEEAGNEAIKLYPQGNEESSPGLVSRDDSTSRPYYTPIGSYISALDSSVDDFTKETYTYHEGNIPTDSNKDRPYNTENKPVPDSVPASVPYCRRSPLDSPTIKAEEYVSLETTSKDTNLHFEESGSLVEVPDIDLKNWYPPISSDASSDYDRNIQPRELNRRSAISNDAADSGHKNKHDSTEEEGTIKIVPQDFQIDHEKPVGKYDKYKTRYPSKKKSALSDDSSDFNPSNSDEYPRGAEGTKHKEPKVYSKDPSPVHEQQQSTEEEGTIKILPQDFQIGHEKPVGKYDKYKTRYPSKEKSALSDDSSDSNPSNSHNGHKNPRCEDDTKNKDPEVCSKNSCPKKQHDNSTEEEGTIKILPQESQIDHKKPVRKYDKYKTPHPSKKKSALSDSSADSGSSNSHKKNKHPRRADGTKNKEPEHDIKKKEDTIKVLPQDSQTNHEKPVGKYDKYKTRYPKKKKSALSDDSTDSDPGNSHNKQKHSRNKVGTKSKGSQTIKDPNLYKQNIEPYSEEHILLETTSKDANLHSEESIPLVQVPDTSSDSDRNTQPREIKNKSALSDDSTDSGPSNSHNRHKHPCNANGTKNKEPALCYNDLCPGYVSTEEKGTITILPQDSTIDPKPARKYDKYKTRHPSKKKSALSQEKVVVVHQPQWSESVQEDKVFGRRKRPASEEPSYSKRPRLEDIPTDEGISRKKKDKSVQTHSEEASRSKRPHSEDSTEKGADLNRKKGVSPKKKIKVTKSHSKKSIPSDDVSDTDRLEKQPPCCVCICPEEYPYRSKNKPFYSDAADKQIYTQFSPQSISSDEIPSSEDSTGKGTNPNRKNGMTSIKKMKITTTHSKESIHSDKVIDTDRSEKQPPCGVCVYPGDHSYRSENKPVYSDAANKQTYKQVSYESSSSDDISDFDISRHPVCISPDNYPAPPKNKSIYPDNKRSHISNKELCVLFSNVSVSADEEPKKKPKLYPQNDEPQPSTSAGTSGSYKRSSPYVPSSSYGNLGTFPCAECKYEYEERSNYTSESKRREGLFCYQDGRPNCPYLDADRILEKEDQNETGDSSLSDVSDKVKSCLSCARALAERMNEEDSTFNDYIKSVCDQAIALNQTDYEKWKYCYKEKYQIPDSKPESVGNNLKHTVNTTRGFRVRSRSSSPDDPYQTYKVSSKITITSRGEPIIESIPDKKLKPILKIRTNNCAPFETCIYKVPSNTTTSKEISSIDNLTDNEKIPGNSTLVDPINTEENTTQSNKESIETKSTCTQYSKTQIISEPTQTEESESTATEYAEDIPLEMPCESVKEYLEKLRKDNIISYPPNEINETESPSAPTSMYSQSDPTTLSYESEYPSTKFSEAIAKYQKSLEEYNLNRRMFYRMEALHQSQLTSRNVINNFSDGSATSGRPNFGQFYPYKVQPPNRLSTYNQPNSYPVVLSTTSYPCNRPYNVICPSERPHCFPISPDYNVFHRTCKPANNYFNHPSMESNYERDKCRQRFRRLSLQKQYCDPQDIPSTSRAPDPIPQNYEYCDESRRPNCRVRYQFEK